MRPLYFLELHPFAGCMSNAIRRPPFFYARRAFTSKSEPFSHHNPRERIECLEIVTFVFASLLKNTPTLSTPRPMANFLEYFHNRSIQACGALH